VFGGPQTAAAADWQRRAGLDRLDPE